MGGGYYYSVHGASISSHGYTGKKASPEKLPPRGDGVRGVRFEMVIDARFILRAQ